MADFAIPQSLRDFCNLQTGPSNMDVVAVAIVPEKKGELMIVAAMLDEIFAKEIVRHLSHIACREDFEDLIIDRINFEPKFTILKKLILRRTGNPIDNEYATFITALKELRNFAAHNYGMKQEKALELVKNVEVVKIATDFPAYCYQQLTAIESYLATINSLAVDKPTGK